MSINILTRYCYPAAGVQVKVQSDLYSDEIIFDKFENGFLKQIDPFNNFIKSIFEESSVEKSTGILPPGVRYISNGYVIYERQPEYKNIFIIPKLVNEINDSDQSYSFRLPIPWQLYIIQYTTVIDDNNNKLYYPSNVKLHFMKESLHSIDQEVYLAPLSNFYTDGMLCRPMFSSMEETERYSKDIAGVIQAAYDWIWNCGSNLDLTESCLQMFTQFENKDIKETILGTLYTTNPFSFNIHSYYINYTEVAQMFKAWELVPLHEVSNKLWPSNSVEHNFSNDRRSLTSGPLLLEYFKDMGITPEYELHYDEDEDNEYQCDESFCNCNIPINDFNMRQFLQKIYNGKLYPPPLTLKDSLMLMYEKFDPRYNFNQVQSLVYDFQIKNALSEMETKILLQST